LAQEDKFRPDLLDRLAFDVIHLPPLRHRQEDIPLLAQHYAIRMCRELALPLFTGFSPEAKEQMMAYHWPGNVRELKNVIERAVYHNGAADTPIYSLTINPFANDWEPEHTTAQAATRASSAPMAEFPLNYKEWQENNDIRLLTTAMEKAHHNQKSAAQLLGLSYHQLRGMLRKYNMVGQPTEKDVSQE
jgi:psp operon transcriptional activator